MIPHPIVVYPTPKDGGYVSVVPDLPGCTAHGATAEEAVREAQVAMQLWLEFAEEDGISLPEACRCPIIAAVG